jgi:hypothetical protein
MILPKGDYWYSVSNELKTRKLTKPNIKKNNVYIWVHICFDHQFDQYTSLFRYEIYSPNLVPFQLSAGGFTCTSIGDYCKSIGCGNYYSIKYTITDKFKIPRSDFGSAQQIDGVVEIIQLLRELSKYNDWYQYDLRHA